MSRTEYSWEVIVARNIDPPYRYSQEYRWLEVRAENQIEAINKAKDWAHQQGLEATDMVRRTTPHEGQAGHFPDGRPADVIWHVPVVSDMPPGSLVRDPVSGFRVGYIAWPGDEQAVGLDLESKGYRLINAKPSGGSRPIAVAPIVSSIEYSFRQKSLED
jgi:hypothetical protein